MKTQETIAKMLSFTRFEATEAGTGKKVRCMKEDAENIFVFAKGKKRYGTRYSVETFCRWYELVPKKDETVAWRRRMKRAVATLSESGLWPDVRKTFEELLSWDITWEEKREIRDLYFDGWSKQIPDRDQKIKMYASKYPKIVYMGSNGEYVFDSEYLYERSDCRTKSMYFGKWDNARIKEEIAKRLTEKKNYSVRETVGYDVSFEYKADANKAWYSEEYRGCGNGHYYLALNNSLALFCEDD